MSDPSSDRLLETWRLARQKRRAFGMLAVIAGVFGVIVALITPSRYTAHASFLPASQSSTELGGGLGGLGSLGGLAGVLGGPLLGSFGQRSAQFFTDLAKSRTFLDSLAASSVQVDTPDKVLRVADYLITRARTPADRRWKARNALKHAVVVSLLPSGMVVLNVTTKSPYASAAIANRAIAIIDELNLDFRHREAAARRRFTQQFLEDVQQRLTDAQDRLVQFLTTNRTFVTPALQNKQQLLQTEVGRLSALQQQLETSIENARLTEYNNAPVVASVDVAAVPERRSGPQRKLIVAGAILLALLGGFWALYLRLWR